jgi:hypothetical protein
MLTLSKQFGSVDEILSEARRIAQVTEHDVEFEFNGVWCNVSTCYMGTPNQRIDIQRIIHAVKIQQTDILYL